MSDRDKDAGIDAAPLPQVYEQVPGLVSDPGSGRVGRDIHDVDGPAGVSDDERDVDPLAEHGIDVEMPLRTRQADRSGAEISLLSRPAAAAAPGNDRPAGDRPVQDGGPQRGQARRFLRSSRIGQRCP